MRVTLIAYSLEDYAVEYANALSLLCDVTLFASRVKMIRQMPFVNPRVELRILNWPRMRSLRNLIFLPKLLRAIRKTSPDVVHNLSPTFFWFGAMIKGLAQAKAFTTVHDVRPHLGDTPSRKVPVSLVRWSTRQSPGLLVHGRALKDLLARELRIDLERIFEAPHPALCRYGALARDLKPARDSMFRVLCFGRMFAYKGVPDIVACERMVAAQRQDVQFVIAGAGPAIAAARTLAARDARIEWVDRFVPDVETAQLFLDADVVVLPYYEGSQSGVLALAAVFGKPVVATRVGSIAEVVESSAMGLITEPRDPQGLSEAILKLAGDCEFRRKMAEGARRLAETTWSHASVAKRALAIYQNGNESDEE